MKITKDYIFFWGDNDVFSNFYNTSFEYHGINVDSSEQAFMMEKAWAFKDTEIARDIYHARSAQEAKKLGRQVRNYDDAVWSRIRYDKMVKVLRVKFSDSDLTEKLLATGNRILVEASPYDKIWGVGLSEATPKVLDPKNWQGQNLLGKALMQVRAELLAELEESGGD